MKFLVTFTVGFFYGNWFVYNRYIKQENSVLRDHLENLRAEYQNRPKV